MFGSIDLFIAGMVAAEVHQKMQERKIKLNLAWPIAVSIAIGAVVTLLFTHRPFFQVDYAGVAADRVSRSALWGVWPTLEAGMWSILLLVYLNAVQSIPASSFVAALGKYSYSIYAWHILVIEIAKAQFLWLSPYAFGALVVLPVTMLISWWAISD